MSDPVALEEEEEEEGSLLEDCGKEDGAGFRICKGFGGSAYRSILTKIFFKEEGIGLLLLLAAAAAAAVVAELEEETARASQ